ncbi:YrdB family protein [Bacillus sp. JJ1521]|uniref:YrdB family protein n=1 Tax=Bacillus sp. JJ1521 TaxID=3122957 RepID=UPI002FFFC3BF
MTLLIMAIRFVWEFLALIIFGLWGFHHGKFLGAIGIPLVVVVIWAILGSPGAPYKLPGFYGIILELFLFLAASYTLYKLGHTQLAFTYCIVALITSFLIHYMNI